MERAKIFFDGEHQLIKLPKECSFEGDEVLVNRVGEAVVMLPKGKPLAGVLAGIDMFTPDFMEDYDGTRENKLL